jgi:hypothetical protein
VRRHPRDLEPAHPAAIEPVAHLDGIAGDQSQLEGHARECGAVARHRKVGPLVFRRFVDSCSHQFCS